MGFLIGALFVVAGIIWLIGFLATWIETVVEKESIKV